MATKRRRRRKSRYYPLLIPVAIITLMVGNAAAGVVEHWELGMYVVFALFGGACFVCGTFTHAAWLGIKKKRKPKPPAEDESFEYAPPDELETGVYVLHSDYEKAVRAHKRVKAAAKRAATAKAANDPLPWLRTGWRRVVLGK